MSEWVMLLLMVIVALCLLSVSLNISLAITGRLTQGLRSVALFIGNAARSTIECARILFMHKRESPSEAIAYSIGSVWQVAIGTQILWTDVVFASAALAGLTSVPFSGAGIHYDLLLGISAVGSAVIFSEDLANLLGWVKTNHFSTAERGRIFCFFVTVGGLCGSLLTLGALALYRSQMLTEGVDPTTLSSWATYLPHGILIGISILLLAASLLAFTVVDMFFVTTAGSLCVLAGGLLWTVELTATVCSFLTELVGKILETISEWWSDRGIVSNTASDLFRNLAEGLKNLVAVKPNKHAEVIPPHTSPTAATKQSAKPTADQEMIVPIKAHVTDIKVNKEELVGVGGRGIDKARNNHRYEH